MSNDRTPVVVVVGASLPERHRLATRIARRSDRVFVPSERLAASFDPVSSAVGLAGQVEAPAGVVIEAPTSGPSADLIAALADGEGGTLLEDAVCVIDAAAGLDELFRDDALPSGQHSATVSRPLAVMALLELASTLVVVNWEDLPTEDLQILLAMVHHLCPHGRLRLQEPGSVEVTGNDAYDAELVRPGWACLLSGRFEAFVTHERVSAFRYDCVRPFHPGRLHELVHDLMTPGRLGTVVRSAGHCRMATSPHVTGIWNHVGTVLTLRPAVTDDGLDQLLDPWADAGPMSLGQDLAFIGLDLDREGLVSALDDAVLTDAEFLAGPPAWRELLKPYL